MRIIQKLRTIKQNLNTLISEPKLSLYDVFFFLTIVFIVTTVFYINMLVEYGQRCVKWDRPHMRYLDNWEFVEDQNKIFESNKCPVGHFDMSMGGCY